MGTPCCLAWGTLVALGTVTSVLKTRELNFESGQPGPPWSGLGKVAAGARGSRLLLAGTQVPALKLEVTCPCTPGKEPCRENAASSTTWD